MMSSTRPNSFRHRFSASKYSNESEPRPRCTPGSDKLIFRLLNCWSSLHVKRYMLSSACQSQKFKENTCQDIFPPSSEFDEWYRSAGLEIDSSDFQCLDVAPIVQKDITDWEIMSFESNLQSTICGVWTKDDHQPNPVREDMHKRKSCLSKHEKKRSTRSESRVNHQHTPSSVRWSHVQPHKSGSGSVTWTSDRSTIRISSLSETSQSTLLAEEPDSFKSASSNLNHEHSAVENQSPLTKGITSYAHPLERQVESADSEHTASSSTFSLPRSFSNTLRSTFRTQRRGKQVHIVKLDSGEILFCDSLAYSIVALKQEVNSPSRYVADETEESQDYQHTLATIEL